jgi:hypothetical protein
MTDTILPTQTPDQPPQTRPVPPSWASVAPLLARWQIALVPHPDGTWDVRAFGVPLVPPYGCHHVRWGDVPQVVTAVAAWCAQEATLSPPRG